MARQLMNLNKLGLAALLWTLALTAAHAGAIPRDVSLAPLVKQVSPAVVNIATRGTVELQSHPMMDDPFFRRFFEQQPAERETGSLGSGVIINAGDGLILTNHHVIAEADEITVQLEDGREFAAELVGSDEGSDVALLRIAGDNLTDVKFGDSESLEVGDYVLALGNPFGLGHTVTSGIVSAKGRNGLNIERYEDFIQTDAAINRGNSGGALINLQGELIGINTAILGPGGGNAGIGFAIPSAMASTVMDQILTYGKVSRGLLGITGEAVTSVIAEVYGLKEVRGAVVTTIQDDSGADKAGLEVDDVILAVNGESIDNFQDLRNVIGLKRPGEAVELNVVRDGRERKITAILGSLEEREVAQAEPARESGLSGARLTEVPSDHPLADQVDGVMVESVERGSRAQRQGLQPGDVITAINRKPVKSLSDIERIMETKSDRYLLKVRRGPGAFFVVVS